MEREDKLLARDIIQGAALGCAPVIIILVSAFGVGAAIAIWMIRIALGH